MGVENHRAHRFMLGDDLVESRFGRESHQRQAREPYPAIEADDLKMPPDLIAIAVVDSLDQPERTLAGISDLQVSDARIDPQRAQRSVIPGQFVIRGQAGERLGGRPARVEQDPRIVVGPGKGFESVERMRSDHQNDDAVALLDKRAMAQKIIARRRSRDDCDKLLQDSILLAERQCIRCRRVETVEPDNDVDPIVVRRERHLDFGYDPVRPIGMHCFV